MSARSTSRRPRSAPLLTAAFCALVAATLSGCSSDGLTEPRVDGTTLVSGTARGDSVASGVPNAVAGIRIAPRAITIGIGATTVVSLVPVDANGIPTLALLAKPASFRVANGAVALVTDGGIVRGVAAGTTTLYATVGALIDSATIVVSAAPGTASGDSSRVPAAGLRLYGPGTLLVAQSGSATAMLVDATGRFVSPRGKNPSFTIDDPSIARVGTAQIADTAIYATVTGVAVGRTVLHATIDGVTQSIALVVNAPSTPPRDSSTTNLPRDSSTTRPPRDSSATTTPPVASFTLTTYIVAQSASRTDTLPLPQGGATVTVYRLEPVSASSDTSGTRVQVATATTDASGIAIFRALPSATYTVIVQPPAGSALKGAESTFGPARTDDLRLGFVLLRP